MAISNLLEKKDNLKIISELDRYAAATVYVKNRHFYSFQPYRPRPSFHYRDHNIYDTNTRFMRHLFNSYGEFIV